MPGAPTLKARRMAYLFVHGGPDYGEDPVERWNRCAEAATYRKPPALNSPMQRALILEEGGEPPFLGDELVGSKQGEGIPPTLDLEADIEMPTSEEGWRKLAEELLPEYLKVARGEATITPQRRLVLEKVMERGFGKPGADKADETAAPAHIVILPTLSSGRGTQICPRCLQRLKATVEEVPHGESS